jgi:flagellar FliJ protein
MKRFSFQLDALLKIRKRKEEEITIRLAAKRQQIGEARQQMAELGEQLQAEQSLELQRRDREPTLSAMRSSVLYRFNQKRQMLVVGQQVDKLYLEADAIQSQLTKAIQQRRVIELLRERRFEAWKKEARRKEQIALDDISQQGYIRKQLSASSHAAH